MRAFAWFVGAIVLAGVIGAVLAYPAYELTSAFASWAFHRVASRVAMLVLIAELVWLCRHLNLTRARDFGYGLPWRRFLKVSCAWGAIGIATAAIGAAFLLSTHLRVLAPGFMPTLPNFAPPHPRPTSLRQVASICGDIRTGRGRRRGSVIRSSPRSCCSTTERIG